MHFLKQCIESSIAISDVGLVYCKAVQFSWELKLGVFLIEDYIAEIDIDLFVNKITFY